MAGYFCSSIDVKGAVTGEEDDGSHYDILYWTVIDAETVEEVIVLVSLLLA